MTRTRTSTSGAVLLAVLAALLVAPLSEPALAGEHCEDVVLVLDESGSIAPNESIVRTAVGDFLAGISDSGASVAIVEFGSASNPVFDFTPATTANRTSMFAPYLEGTSPGDIYDPPSQTGPYTNWDDALDDVSLLDTSLHPDPLVLFLTDGDPTAYNLDHSGEGGGFTFDMTGSTALSRAVDEAAEIQAQGSHMIAVGVGSALTQPASVGRLEAVTGTRHFDGSGALDLYATDVVLVPDFADLPAVMALIAEAMCADPGIELTKTADAPVITAGSEVTYTLVATNIGNVTLYDVVVTDPLVPTCSLAIGVVEAGESVTFQCSTILWAPLTNTATATGSDAFGSTVEDDDSASVTLLARGTGTPGYWKNHRDAWPVFGDTMIIGDWNHDGACTGDEVCLTLSIEQAASTITQPASGDTTWILGRALVTAWLNVSAGNDASCIAPTIDAATAWVLAHPLGSGVAGGDAAWAEGEPLAGALDAYNNGHLCGEHRDAIAQDESDEPTEATQPATTTTTTKPGKGQGRDRRG